MREPWYRSGYVTVHKRLNKDATLPIGGSV